jgi:ABC-2 type transport system permease protein
MKRLRVLLGREISRTFCRPLAWLVLACFLLLTGINFQAGVSAMNAAPGRVTAVAAFFNSLLFWFPFLLSVPLLTMRVFSEEYKLGTMETLMTAPVRDWEVVAAKFGGALAFFVLLWLPTAIYFPVFWWVSGEAPAGAPGAAFGAATILLFAGSFYLSIGCLASALTDNQIVAAIATGAAVCASFFIGLLWFFFPSPSPELRNLAYTFSTIEHMADFSEGVFDSRPLVLYATLSALMLFLTYHALQWRRWRS